MPMTKEQVQALLRRMDACEGEGRTFDEDVVPREAGASRLSGSIGYPDQNPSKKRS